MWFFSLSTGGLSRLILSHDGLRMAVNSMRAAKVLFVDYQSKYFVIKIMPIR